MTELVIAGELIGLIYLWTKWLRQKRQAQALAHQYRTIVLQRDTEYLTLCKFLGLMKEETMNEERWLDEGGKGFN